MAPQSVEVRAPQDQEEGTRSQVLRWLKAVGEPVAEHEPLLELETDKVTVEVPSLWQPPGDARRLGVGLRAVWFR